MSTHVLPEIHLPVSPVARGRSDSAAPEIGLESAGLMMTPEEFDGIAECDERYRYELIRGVLIVNPIPAHAEADPNDELGFLLREYRRRHPQGACLDRTMPERFVPTPNSRRRADRVIWAGLGRRPNPDVDVPTIVVEFVSASRRDWRRDYVEKRREYGELGVQEYWIIDRFSRTLTVCRRTAAGDSQVLVTEGETYRTELLPGFELPLAQLLGIADDWDKS